MPCVHYRPYMRPIVRGAYVSHACIASSPVPRRPLPGMTQRVTDWPRALPAFEAHPISVPM
eukprot:13212374-Alexandrium_andersonii.AAC.1